MGNFSILIIWVENTLIHKALRQNNMFREIITYASSISKIGFCSLNLSKSEQLVTPEYLKNLGIKEEIDMPGFFLIWNMPILMTGNFSLNI